MRGPLITPEVMKKAWLLYNEHVSNNLIADTLNISLHSVQRIIAIMTAAQSGDDVDAVDGYEKYQSQKAFAKKFFGIEEKKEEIEKQSKELECVSAVADMQKLLAMIAWQNELLEALLNSLGVDWQNHCKGVERR